MREVTMAKTNFQYEKRQRELEKKRKADEKARRKQEARHKAPGEEGSAVEAAQVEAESVGQGERDPA
jgi:hypothetical protein